MYADSDFSFHCFSFLNRGDEFSAILQIANEETTHISLLKVGKNADAVSS